MPRPRVDPEKQLSEKVNVKLTPPQLEALHRARNGRPVSEWIREKILPLLRAWLR
jgi:hypothetical protein